MNTTTDNIQLDSIEDQVNKLQNKNKDNFNNIEIQLNGVRKNMNELENRIKYIEMIVNIGYGIGVLYLIRKLF